MYAYDCVRRTRPRMTFTRRLSKKCIRHHTVYSLYSRRRHAGIFIAAPTAGVSFLSLPAGDIIQINSAATAATDLSRPGRRRRVFLCTLLNIHGGKLSRSNKFRENIKILIKAAPSPRRSAPLQGTTQYVPRNDNVVPRDGFDPV